MKEGKSASLPCYGGVGQETARPEEAKLVRDPVTGTSLIPCPLARQSGGKMVYLRIAKQYTHMGIKTLASGSVAPELQSRHSSTIPYVHRLTWQYFRKTQAQVQKKLGVASSLLLSTETFGVGCMPVLNTGERQILHRNIVGVYRRATSTSTVVDAELNHGYSDAVLLHAYGLRAPYAYVRFHRLRLSVRFFGKAPFQLVVLVCSAAADKRSWIHALIMDLAWLTACDKDCVFCLRTWYRFVKNEPQTNACVD